jgi:hypothetical protein
MNIIAWNPETDVAVMPERLPEIGEYAKFEDGNSIWFCGYNPAPTFTDLEIAEMSARDWRDIELSSSDFIVPLSDHPQRAVYMAYRESLRTWPSTDSFPATRPELGA